jgi:MFS family permease
MQFVCNVPAVIGAALVYSLPANQSVGRLIAFYCTNFTNGSLPMMFALTTTNIAGHTKRGVASAIMFMGYSVGFIIGPQFFLASEAPVYTTGFETMMIVFALACTLPGLYYAYVTWQNNKRAKALVASGEANIHILNEEFFDLTDKEQVHFVYSK